MATIKQVADTAGVSISTVSHVLNETRYVSSDLRDRVLAAVAELGYQRNAAARTLRSGKSNTIGLILPDSSNPYFSEIARHIQNTAFDEGFSVLICNTDDYLEKEEIYSALLIEKQVDGVIMIAAGASGPHILDLQKRGIPISVVDRASPEARVDSVQIDNYMGGALATEHLVGLGHRRIACVTGRPDVYPSYDRVEGYLGVMHKAGLEIPEQYVVHSTFRADGGYEAARTLFSLPEPPTAIFCCNDLMALGAIGAATESGIRCPQELSIVGFDDIQLAQYSNPPLTTIRQPKQEMAAAATQFLVERMTAPDLHIREAQLKAHLVVRQSTSRLHKN